MTRFRVVIEAVHLADWRGHSRWNVFARSVLSSWVKSQFLYLSYTPGHFACPGNKILHHHFQRQYSHSWPPWWEQNPERSPFPCVPQGLSCSLPLHSQGPGRQQCQKPTCQDLALERQERECCELGHLEPSHHLIFSNYKSHKLAHRKKL